MSRQSLTSEPFRWIETILEHIAKPFYKADSLERYKTAGYLYLFGSFMLIILTSLWYFGYLTASINQLPPNLSNSIKYVLSFGRSNSNLELPMSLLVCFLYVSLYLVKTARLAIGGFFANVFFNLMSIPVAVGEWCIEHRSKTTILFILLFGFLAWGIPHEVEKYKETQRLSDDFNFWFKSVDNFIELSPLAGQEFEVYDKVYPWNKEFEEVIRPSGGTTHTASCLHDMLEIVYKEGMNISPTYLEEILPELEGKIESCKPGQESEMSGYEARAWVLMNILMGRVYVRLSSEYIFSSDKHKIEPALLAALACFNKAEATLNAPELKNAPEIMNLYRAAASNGQGTVYANAFTAFYQKGINPLPLYKDTPAECANAALSAYDNSTTYSAEQDPGSCSFLHKRKRNNIAALLLRIGHWRGEIDNRSFHPPLSEWAKDPKTLREKLESEIMEMMKCNDIEPLLARVVFYTAAEAYAVCAKLREDEIGKGTVKDLGEDTEAVNYIKKAATYLRLAYSYRKRITKLTNSYFEFLNDNKKLHQEFFKALNAEELKDLPVIPKDQLEFDKKEGGGSD